MKIRCAILLGLFMLAGCGNQQAGYQIADRNHSLSVTRSQQYPGSAWVNYLIVTNYPTCQRRYKLKDSPGLSFKMDVYQVEPQVFILSHSKRWYVAETNTCNWQQYETPPPEPGDLIGTFQAKTDGLKWEDKSPKKDAASPK
jgi:hypothetical protein